LKALGYLIKISRVTAHSINNLSVQSNQNMQSKPKSMQSKMGKRGVQLFTYLQFDLWNEE